MKIHILGICGTFMAGVAILAKKLGHEVSGSDMNVYPPMSTLLASEGIALRQGFAVANLDADVDCVIVGNIISRGNELIEYVLAKHIPYTSGPQWLAEHVLTSMHVLAVAGTHGKTTTTSILAWMLDYAGLNPGFLIGGVPENFGVSAQLGRGDLFVIEADEYDSAFFDKRSKFIHYRPNTLILNNLEFDHADIFPDLAAIQQQMHLLVRTVPNNGLIIHPAADQTIEVVLAKGCWTPVTTFGLAQGHWQAKLLSECGSHFEVYLNQALMGTVEWSLLGMHNIHNALAALAAANHVGASVTDCIASLASFKNVKRRLEIKGKVNDITIYDDFAHHPTAIATTVAGLRAKVGSARIIVVLEFGSYTMRSGFHKDHIQSSLVQADMVFCKRLTDFNWELEPILEKFTQPTIIGDNVTDLIEQLTTRLKPQDHVLIMSNSGFDGIHAKLLQALSVQGEVYASK
jgi:UDP-N-acetylmuramate: L-alanyl-gamma-D-glutamyl-meso-diaminopimelate ligase